MTSLTYLKVVMPKFILKESDKQNTINVEYHLHTNGTIMIYITCTDRPFRLYEDQDISIIMVFLGRVEDRLRRLLSDTRDEVILHIRKWIKSL